MNAEEAAMIAAGETDADLQDGIHKMVNTRHLSDGEVILLRAYVDERENREQARFQTALHELGVTD
jgi:hypothetical protein